LIQAFRTFTAVSIRTKPLGWAFCCALFVVATPGGELAWAAGRGDIHKLKEGFANEVPKPLEEVGIDPRQGGKVDLNLSFTDHEGKKLALKDLLGDGKPILLSLAYYSCPSLCNFHLNGLNDAFRKMPKALGEEFRLVVVSIDPSEKPELAKAKWPPGRREWLVLSDGRRVIHSLARTSRGFQVSLG
jgi:cytochrome oxidase Cu insertion factor (SCO1/SenC/PrrC family)